jgi:soluble lytic murein transglycosylase
VGRPLSAEAQESRARLAEMGVEASLSTAERRSLADAYYNGRRYGDAAEQYRMLARSTEIDPGLRNTFAVADAACDWKLKRLIVAKAQALADTNDEAGARRSYLLMELARDRDSQSDQQRIVSDMETRFPRSPWLAEALYSSGNMYLLKRDYASAADYYAEYAQRFPSAKNGSLAHWKSGWLNYRLGQFDTATRIFDDQIRLFPSSTETIGALYWRGRLYEAREHNAAMAAANYRAILRSSPHYYYAQLARQRLAALGTVQAVDEQRLSRFQPLPAPTLVESFPEASPHMAKARLLANAGLNDYVAKEIAADPDFGSASELAAAQIYASYGETLRALHIAKRAIPYSASAPVASIPLVYWRILYPEPYWQTIKTEAAKYNLDPYLVASLMRQESEFDPSVVSYANAWGLMQLLPTTGKQMAKAEGMSKFQTFQLLDPATNIRLGTRYLKQMLDKFGGVQEYALAAYNAGDGRVADWESAGPYHGMDEFVESIPFTQTREYVQSILRNEEMYRAIDAYASTQGAQKAR